MISFEDARGESSQKNEQGLKEISFFDNVDYLSSHFFAFYFFGPIGAIILELIQFFKFHFDE